MSWIIENHMAIVHVVGSLLLVVSEALALRKDPTKAKGIIDAIVKWLGRDDQPIIK